MNFTPDKLFIGLMDFFSIIMPGALCTYVIRFKFSNLLPAGLTLSLSNGEDWMAFLFVSYLLGHFAFLIGSLLDSVVYGPLRDSTRKLLAPVLPSARDVRKQSIVFRIKRSCVRWFFGPIPDAPLDVVKDLKTAALGPKISGDAINSFQWCKARLSREHPAALGTVQRFEADSKFFRSFTVVLLLLTIVLAWNREFSQALVCVVFTLLALWRYIDQRFKSTQQAYWFILTLDRSNSASNIASTPSVRV